MFIFKLVAIHILARQQDRRDWSCLKVQVTLIEPSSSREKCIRRTLEIFLKFNDRRMVSYHIWTFLVSYREEKKSRNCSSEMQRIINNHVLF